MDDEEIRYGDSTRYDDARLYGRDTWNNEGDVLIAPDDATVIEDLRFADYTNSDDPRYAFYHFAGFSNRDEIRFNVPKMNNLTTIQRRTTAAHELGHAMGFAHNPDTSQGVQLMHNDPLTVFAAGVSTPQLHDRADHGWNWSGTLRAHVRDVGWQQWVGELDVAGTTGQNKPIEALNLVVLEGGNFGCCNNVSGQIDCNAHVQNIGWMGFIGENGTCGTTGQALNVEAVQLRLVNVSEGGYTITYQCHVSGLGWLGWVGSGETCGTTGQNRAVEAIRINVSGG